MSEEIKLGEWQIRTQPDLNPKPKCKTCDDMKRIIYHISQDWTESIDCPDCNGGNRKDYERLERALSQSLWD